MKGMAQLKFPDDSITGVYNMKTVKLTRSGAMTRIFGVLNKYPGLPLVELASLIATELGFTTKWESQ